MDGEDREGERETSDGMAAMPSPTIGGFVGDEKRSEKEGRLGGEVFVLGNWVKVSVFGFK